MGAGPQGVVYFCPEGGGERGRERERGEERERDMVPLCWIGNKGQGGGGSVGLEK